LYDDPNGLVDRVAWAIANPVEASGIADSLAAAVAPFEWSTVAPAYDRVLEGLAEGGKGDG
jgi:glycosyltransferase involved in cell wall biosynthesis